MAFGFDQVKVADYENGYPLGSLCHAGRIRSKLHDSRGVVDGVVQRQPFSKVDGSSKPKGCIRGNPLRIRSIEV